MNDPCLAAPDDPPLQGPSAQRHVHSCMVCAGNASFGYTTRRGPVWTCLAHRQSGEQELLAPTA